MNKLIADSGATKADWYLINGSEVLEHLSSKGISPVFQKQQEITNEIKSNIYPTFKKWNIDEVYFYGSGCTADNIPIVKEAIHQSLSSDKIVVNSDLVAAAHSLCGHEAGIACILGTGSNSCEWDGENISKQISPLGFILGDEGSGASMGKKLISDALKNQLTTGLKEKLLEEYELTPATIIDRVYRQPFPSRFLASLSPFIKKHIDDKSVKQIVVQNLSEFLKRNVMQYNYKELNVNFVGSIGWHYKEILKEVAKSNGIKVGRIDKSPMDGLLEFHGKSL